MITLNQETFKSQEVLSSINFIRNSDLIFIATLSTADIESLGIKEYRVVEQNNELLTILNLKFKLKENDIVYCHTDYVESLFEVLKNFEFSNIKLISSQSDRKVGKKLFSKKSACISTWYSTNVIFEDINLVPLPLGIAPYRNTKSAIIKDFEYVDETIVRNKYIYANFSLYTNYFHRFGAMRHALKKLNLKIIDNIEYDLYTKALREYKLTLCPWGNGLDTHRFWEAIYSGSIPVTKRHKMFESFNDLPMILLNSYKEIGSIDNQIKFEDFDLIKLKIDWWIQKIYSNKVESSKPNVEIYLNDDLFNFTINHLYKLKVHNKRKKDRLTFLRKIHEKLVFFI